MSIGTIIAQAASGLAAPITGYLGKREETKQVTKTVDAKLAEVKLDNRCRHRRYNESNNICSTRHLCI